VPPEDIVTLMRRGETLPVKTAQMQAADQL
jgi:hypothetical protein